MEIEANIDDQSSEQLSYAMKLFLKMGAKDVFFTPIVMKKSRMATKLTLLIDPSKKDDFIHAIFNNTTTLGIRYEIKHRIIMNRKLTNINTHYGNVRVNLAHYKDIKRYDIEYEDCAKLAKIFHCPIEEIYFETKKLCKRQQEGMTCFNI